GRRRKHRALLCSTFVFSAVGPGTLTQPLHMSPRRGTSRPKPSSPRATPRKRPAAPADANAAVPSAASAPVPLETYRRKRDPDRTPEPFGSTAAPAPAPATGERFVVQQHWARNMHFDLR